MQEQVYTVKGRAYPVLRHVDGIPVVDIPMMTDGRWVELSRRRPVCTR